MQSAEGDEDERGCKMQEEYEKDGRKGSAAAMQWVRWVATVVIQRDYPPCGTRAELSTGDDACAH